MLNHIKTQASRPCWAGLIWTGSHFTYLILSKFIADILNRDMRYAVAIQSMAKFERSLFILILIVQTPEIQLSKPPNPKYLPTFPHRSIHDSRL